MIHVKRAFARDWIESKVPTAAKIDSDEIGAWREAHVVILAVERIRAARKLVIIPKRSATEAYKLPADVQVKIPPPWSRLQGPGPEEHLCSFVLQKRPWPASQYSRGTVSQPLFLKTQRAKILQSIQMKPVFSNVKNIRWQSPRDGWRSNHLELVSHCTNPSCSL